MGASQAWKTQACPWLTPGTMSNGLHFLLLQKGGNFILVEILFLTLWFLPLLIRLFVQIFFQVLLSFESGTWKTFQFLQSGIMGSCSVCPLQCQSCSMKKRQSKTVCGFFLPFLFIFMKKKKKKIYPPDLRSCQINIISIISEITISKSNSWFKYASHQILMNNLTAS